MSAFTDRFATGRMQLPQFRLLEGNHVRAYGHFHTVNSTAFYTKAEMDLTAIQCQEPGKEPTTLQALIDAHTGNPAKELELTITLTPEQFGQLRQYYGGKSPGAPGVHS